MHSGYTFVVSMCVPWESNPQPFVLLTQCSTTEPQELSQRTNFYQRCCNMTVEQYLLQSYHIYFSNNCTLNHTYKQTNKQQYYLRNILFPEASCKKLIERTLISEFTNPNKSNSIKSNPFPYLCAEYTASLEKSERELTVLETHCRQS